MKIVQAHKEAVLERGYTYLGTYEKGEYTKDKNYLMEYSCRYIRVICPYCKSEYDIKIQLFKKGNKCTHCCNEYSNSFAHYIQCELGESLDKYWDWDKNTTNPYHIYKAGTSQKVWIKCTETDYHGSYTITPGHFTSSGRRCSYCSKHSLVHPKDSFAQWLVNQYGEDALNVYWDYNKNTLNPWEISYGSRQDVWINCVKTNYHGGYKIKCVVFIESKECPYCSKHSLVHPKDSFAQYHIDNTDKDFIEKYWSDKNTLDPWKIAPNTNKTIWIKCAEKDYHDDYRTLGNDFTRGNRCPQCCNFQGNVNTKDSFGIEHPKKAKYWSSKNKKTPFEISSGSSSKYYFICEKCGKEFTRSLAKMTKVNKGVVCKACKSSQYERRIIDWLDTNGFVKDEDYFYDKPYFNDLIGLGGGVLRPDFILPKCKLWIEYDGEFHDGKVYKEDNYETLIKHDELKNEYAIKHGWNLVRINSKQKDNIEEILNNTFKEII